MLHDESVAIIVKFLKTHFNFESSLSETRIKVGFLEQDLQSDFDCCFTDEFLQSFKLPQAQMAQLLQNPDCFWAELDPITHFRSYFKNFLALERLDC